jgi:hypothetical protein
MILTFDGPTVLLLTQFFFLGEALGHLPRSRLLGLAALAILAIATAPLALIPGIAGRAPCSSRRRSPKRWATAIRRRAGQG